eukprot:XP_014631939.1 serine/threonine-protein kinase ATG1t isoform X2 [Glycine max]
MECEGKLARRVVGVRNHCYLLKSKIGEGSFSAVWRAEQRPPTGDDVAVKQVFLSKLNPRLKACLDCEINFLSSVNHPNIIRLLHFFQYDGCVYLVLEFCAGGNLASYIQNHGRVHQQIARKFMQQLGLYVPVNMPGQSVVLHYTWLQKLLSSRDMMTRQICGVLEPFFLSF